MPAEKKTTATEEVEDQIDDQSGDPSADPAEEEVENPEEVLKLNAKYRRENENLRKRLKDAEGSIETLREQTMSEQEKAIEDARKEGRREAEQEYQGRLLQSSILAAAKGVLQDPEDALNMIDFTGIDPDDAKAISAEIDALIEAKPYLAVSKRQGDIDQGPQGAPVNGQTAADWMRTVVGGRR